MQEITTLEILQALLESLIKYWVLIVGLVSSIIFGYRYLSNKTRQHEQNNNLLSQILKSSKSMDTTVKEMSVQISDMTLQVRDLRKDHDYLVDSHKQLEIKVNNIERGE